MRDQTLVLRVSLRQVYDAGGTAARHPDKLCYA